MNYHAEDNSSTSSVAEDVSNGDMMEANIDVNVGINVWCVNKSKIKIVTKEDRLLIRWSENCVVIPMYHHTLQMTLLKYSVRR